MFTVHPGAEEEGTLTKGCFSMKTYFYALHKFAGTLQIISEVVGVFLNFSYKDQHKNLASISLV